MHEQILAKRVLGGSRGGGQGGGGVQTADSHSSDRRIDVV